MFDYMDANRCKEMNFAFVRLPILLFTAAAVTDEDAAAETPDEDNADAAPEEEAADEASDENADKAATEEATVAAEGLDGGE